MDDEENDNPGRAKSPSVTSASGLRRQQQQRQQRETPSWQSASSGKRSSLPDGKKSPDEKKNSPDLAKLDELIQSLSEM